MTGRPGRPPKHRNVFSYEDNLLVECDEVVVDTSFVLEALLASQKHHVAAKNALAQLASNGAVLHCNVILRAELLEAVYKIALRERYP
ncbi:hypothetical protein BH24ACT15_BH24ACT15_05500 [soil metagenome]